MAPPSAAAGDATKDAAANSNDFPQFPGEDVLAHAGSQWKEAAETRLSTMKLLHVAQGGLPPSVLEIIDVDLTSLPSLPEGHRDFHRREETRIKVMTQNKSNDQRRQTLILEARTAVYALLKTSTETAS